MVAGTVLTIHFVRFGWGDLGDASPEGWTASVHLGLLPSALGFVLRGYAVARIQVAVSTSLLYLGSPIAVLIAWAVAR